MSIGSLWRRLDGSDFEKHIDSFLNIYGVRGVSFAKKSAFTKFYFEPVYFHLIL